MKNLQESLRMSLNEARKRCYIYTFIDSLTKKTLRHINKDASF